MLKKTGAVDVFVFDAPIRISVVEVVFLITPVASSYVQLMSPVAAAGQFVPLARQTD